MKMMIPENNNIKTLLCGNNFLSFSELPLKSFDRFEYSSIVSRFYEPGGNVDWEKEIDLTKEHIIDGYVSKYEWTVSDDLWSEKTSVSISGADGKFELAEDLIGKVLYCRITNERFPDVTVEFIYKVAGNASSVEQDIADINSKLVHLQSSIVSRYEPIILESTSGFSGVAYLYNAWGQTVAGKSKVVSGTTEIPAPMSSGVYLLNVNMDNGSNYTFKILVR